MPSLWRLHQDGNDADDEIVSFTAIAWITLCALGLALSLKSVAVLRGGSLWTSLGWLFSALYFALAGIKVARSWSLPSTPSTCPSLR